MTQIPLLQDILVIFGAAIAVLIICHRLRIPPIVGYLVTGVLIGPSGLRFVSSISAVEQLASVGVILLVFTIGLEFSFQQFIRMRRAVLLGGSLQVVATIAVTWIISRYFGLSQGESVFMGFLIAVSSTAIPMRALQERAELTTPHGSVILSISIFNDVATIPAMIFTPLLVAGAGGIAGELGGLIVKLLVIMALVYVGARYIVPNVLFFIARTRSRELFLLSVVVICMAIAWATNELGLSIGIGAFLAGLIISDSEYSHQALEGVVPFKDVFNSFFFVSVGMLLDTGFLIKEPVAIVAAAAGIYLVKTLIVGGAALALGLSVRSALIAGIALGQVGEFAFVLSQVGVEYGVIMGEVYQTFIAVTIITMAATPLLTNLAPRIADSVAEWPGLRRLRDGAYRSLAGETANGLHSLKDHLVIIGFGVNGQNIARAARSARIPYVIIETNPDTVKRCRKQGEPISYGDATSLAVLNQARIREARVVVVAISDPVATRNITNTVRRQSDRLHLIVRTRFVAEVGPLMELGADEVIPEEFETSVEIFTRVLTRYLVPRDEIVKFTNEIRSHSYEMLRSLSQGTATLRDLQLDLPELRIETVRVPAGSPVVGKSLGELNIRAQCGVTLVAIGRGNAVIPSPAGSDRLAEGDTLYMLGSRENTARAETLVRGPAPANRR